MKNFFKIIFVLLVAAFVVGPVSVLADPSTSFTYVMTDRGFSRTQNAYLPDRTITGLGLSSPQDMFIDQYDNLFIADTGNRRIVVYNIPTGVVDWILEYPAFRSPRGVFVDRNGDIYVADSLAEAVFKFDGGGNLLETFTRPTEPAFGGTSFNPSKIVVNNRGNMFIVSEGVFGGVIHLSNSGAFLGFFTSNRTELSFMQRLQSIFFTRTQLERLADRVPPTIANIFIDNQGVIYTATAGVTQDAIKKHNAAGINMISSFSPGGSVVSLWVDENGIIYSAASNGVIIVYAPDGSLIYLIPAIAGFDDRAGLFTELSSIAVDSNGYMWCVDAYNGFVHSFAPTDYALNTFRALAYFNEGEYTRSQEVWTEVLRLNQMSSLAHTGIGRAYVFNFQYEQALNHFRVAGNRALYSQAYWEVRNMWLQQNLGWIVASIAITYIALVLFSVLDKKKRMRAIKRRIGSRIEGIKPLHDVLYAFVVSRHPVDGFYEISIKKAGSLFGATVLYIFLFAAVLLHQVGRGFIFQYVSVTDIDLSSLVFGFFAILFMFIISNYLSSSIQDGDGKIKDIYLVPAYASLPLTLSLVTVTLLSHVFTQNEYVFINFALYLGVCWTVVNILMGLTQIHNYMFRETIKSLFITIILMLVVGLVLLIFSVMWGQFSQFVIEIFMEVWRNVRGMF